MAGNKNGKVWIHFSGNYANSVRMLGDDENKSSPSATEEHNASALKRFVINLAPVHLFYAVMLD